MLYAFWIVVIGFSMLTLILVYTYQFDKVNEYIKNITGIETDL